MLSNTVIMRYNTGRSIRKSLTGDETYELKSVYWTYDDTPIGSPFNASCSIYWNCIDTDDDQDAISGTATIYDQGYGTTCTVAEESDRCFVNKAFAKAPDVCTKLTSKGLRL